MSFGGWVYQTNDINNMVYFDIFWVFLHTSVSARIMQTLAGNQDVLLAGRLSLSLADSASFKPASFQTSCNLHQFA